MPLTFITKGIIKNDLSTRIYYFKKHNIKIL